MAAACASAAEIPLTRNLVFDFCVLLKLRERPASEDAGVLVVLGESAVPEVVYG